VALLLHNCYLALLLIISGLRHTRIKLVHDKVSLLNGINTNLFLGKVRSWAH